MKILYFLFMIKLNQNRKTLLNFEIGNQYNLSVIRKNSTIVKPNNEYLNDAALIPLKDISKNYPLW